MYTTPDRPAHGATEFSLPTNDAHRRGIAGFVHRHPLGAFFAWFFTVGQAFAFAPLVADRAGVDVPAQPFIVASTLLGLLLPAVVITRIVDGPQALRELWQRALLFRTGLAWYAFALLAVPLLAVVIVAALRGSPADLSASSLTSALISGFLLSLFLTFVPNNWWEEVAWTGFVQARLQARRGPVVAAVITGILFALQHISLAVDGNTVSGAVFAMVLLATLAIPFRFVTGWLYNRTSSLFLVGLLHGVSNAVAGGSGFSGGLLAELYPDDQLALMAHMLAAALIGLAVLVATRRRLGLAHPAAAQPARVSVTVAASRSTGR